MRPKRARVAVFAGMASFVLLAGCGKSDDPAAAASVTGAAAPAIVSSAPAASDIPSACDAYVKKVRACMDRLGAGDPTASLFKQQMDNARAQWASVPDKIQLEAQCKQSAALFAQSSAQMGCQ